jgi:hypothetical protein
MKFCLETETAVLECECGAASASGSDAAAIVLHPWGRLVRSLSPCMPLCLLQS